MISDERIEEIQTELAQARDEAQAEVQWREEAYSTETNAVVAQDIMFELEAWIAKRDALRNAVAALDALYA